MYVSRRLNRYYNLSRDAADGILIICLYLPSGDLGRMITLKEYGVDVKKAPLNRAGEQVIGKILSDNIRSLDEPSIHDLISNDFVNKYSEDVLKMLDEYAKTHNREISVSEYSRY